MRAVSLFLVFVLAKTAVLLGHPVTLSFWTPIAYFWQDAVAALLFGALDWAMPRNRMSLAFLRTLYGVLAIYAAISIPVGRALATPLTWPMLRAAGGPLLDSFARNATGQNAILIALILGAAATLPALLPKQSLLRLAAAALAISALGPIASARIDTHGLDRNIVAALLPGETLHARKQLAGDPRQSMFENPIADDLTRFRGIAKNRNVVMISLESTAAQYLSLYGASENVMPNLNRLAESALVFNNAYAVYPESIKGLFSILCSAWPQYHGPCPALPAELSAHGYRTGLFHSGRFAYLGMESVIRNRGFETLEDAGDIGGNHHSSFGVDEPPTVARILTWLDRTPPGQPFFVTYLPIAGHHPYATPMQGPFPDHDELGRYRNSLHYGDESLGALIYGLRTRHLLDNTMFVIFGDHGEAFGQHEGNYGHTFYLYDENVHVPYLIAVPGAIQTQIRVAKPISLIDTAPTLLDLLGLPIPAGYAGHTMLDNQRRMALFFTDYSLGILGLRDGPWKYVYELDTGRGRLFDLSHDPRETVNRSTNNASRAAQYEERLRQWISHNRS